MAPFPTPFVRESDGEKDLYRGFALSQMAILRNIMKLGGLNVSSRVVTLDNGVVITCRKVFNQEDIFIDVTGKPYSEQVETVRMYPHGFLTHPRSGEINAYPFRLLDSARTLIGGIAHYGKGWKVIEGELVDLNGQAVYPLVDDDGGTMLFAQKTNDDWATIPSKNSAGNWIKSGVTEIMHGEYTKPPGIWAMPPDLNYGNVDWKGPVTPSPKSRLILTYRGNPSRYWPLSQFADIPGLTRIDHTIESVAGDYSYTTPFSEYVYSQGRVYARMPAIYAPMNSDIQRAQVLGAAIRSDGLLVCIVKTCYNTYPRAKAVGEMVSTWQVYSDDMLVKDWLEDKPGAEQHVASIEGGKLVEVIDPGRGYFVEVLLQKDGDVSEGWTRLMRYETPGMANCNFFFSENGMNACSVMFGALHLIEITDDTAVHFEQSLGGFSQTLSTASSTVRTENPGVPDPELVDSLFGGVFRIGVRAGDWIWKDENTKEYVSTKTGITTLAADYKNNQLVKLDATISGNDLYHQQGHHGFKWGLTALPTVPHVCDGGDGVRTPGIRISVDPFDESGQWTGTVCADFGGACQPEVTVAGATFTGTAITGTRVCTTISSKPCLQIGNTIVVHAIVRDAVTNRSTTQIKTYEIDTDMGSWMLLEDVNDGFLSGGPAGYGGWEPYVNGCGKSCSGYPDNWYGDTECGTCNNGGECGPNLTGSGTYSDTGYVTVIDGNFKTITRTQTSTGYGLTYDYNLYTVGVAGGHIQHTSLGQICNGIYLVRGDRVSKELKRWEYICPP